MHILTHTNLRSHTQTHTHTQTHKNTVRHKKAHMQVRHTHINAHRQDRIGKSH